MVKVSLFKDKVKGAVVTALPVVTGLALPITALAAETGASPTGDLFDTVATSMVSSIQDMVSAVGSAIGSIIPVAFPLIAVGMGISICIAVFRRISSQA